MANDPWPGGVISELPGVKPGKILFPLGGKIVANDPLIMYQLQRKSTAYRAGNRWIDVPCLWGKDLDKVVNVARNIRANLQSMPRMRVIRLSLTPPFLGHKETIWEESE